MYLERARHAREVPAVVDVIVLQLALAGLIADGAIQRVVDEEELQLGITRRSRLFVRERNLHAVLDLLGA